MKIAYIITGLGMGGAEHVLSQLADMAYEEGHDVKVFYMTGNIKVAPKNKNIEIIPLHVNGLYSLVKSVFKLRAYFSSFKPDVVHSHMIHANLLARLTRIFSSFPKLICTAHSSNEGGKVRMMAYRITNPLGDFFTNVSNDAARSIENRGAAKLGTVISIPNGVDTNHFSMKTQRADNKSDFFRLISVGRLEEVKNYPTLLKAVHELIARNVNVKLDIVGEGSCRESLEGLISSLKLSENVRLLGAREDVNRLLIQSDLFIISSTYEGFGLVAAEAMSCGLPVISSDNGGVNEILGNNDWIVPVSDYLSLAEKIESTLKMTPEDLKEIGKNNRQRIEDNYSFNNMFDSYSKLYRN